MRGTWFSRETNAWRIGVRLSLREISRHKVRSVLVVLLVAIPVFLGSGILIASAAQRQADDVVNKALASLGSSAEVKLQATTCGDLRQSAADDPAYFDCTGGEPQGSATAAEIAALLPVETRMIAEGSRSYVALESSTFGRTEFISLQNPFEDVIQGLWKLKDGRLPASDTEIALSPITAKQLSVAVGDTIEVTPLGGDNQSSEFTVVGIAVKSDDAFTSLALPTSGLMTEGSNADNYELGVFLETSIDPSLISSLNKIGVLVLSRELLNNPAATCSGENLCAFGLRPVERKNMDVFFDLGRWEDYVFIGFAAVFVVLFIAAVAAPSFAIQLKTRQRELGLLALQGAEASVLRKLMLSSAIVLGGVGSILGVVGAWLAIWLISGPILWQVWAEIINVSEGIPPLPRSVAFVALVGMLAAVVAALAPAIIAGRSRILSVLSGRSVQKPLHLKFPVASVLFLAVGVISVITFSAAWRGQYSSPLSMIGMLAGLVSFQIGLLLGIPGSVALLGRVSGWLPVTARIAIRDAARHRVRTSAAIAAIGAVSAVATGVAMFSSAVMTSSGEVDSTPQNSVITTQVYLDEQSDFTSAFEVGLAAKAVANAALPESDTALTTPLVLQPDVKMCAVLSRELTQGCRKIKMFDYFGESGFTIIDDARSLRALVGDVRGLAEAETALAAGKILSSNTALLLESTESQERFVKFKIKQDGRVRHLEIPAASVESSQLWTGLLITRQALAANPELLAITNDGFRDAKWDNTSMTTALRDNSEISVDQAVFKLYVAYTNAGLDLQAWAASESFNYALLWTIIASVVIFLAVLFVTLTVTALSRFETARDIQIIQQLGGGRSSARKIAGTTAGLVAFIGSISGAVAAVTLYMLIFFSTRDSARILEFIPVAQVSVIVFAIPAIAVIAAAISTKGRKLTD